VYTALNGERYPVLHPDQARRLVDAALGLQADKELEIVKPALPSCCYAGFSEPWQPQAQGGDDEEDG
jgi:hypothetical protein